LYFDRPGAMAMAGYAERATCRARSWWSGESCRGWASGRSWPASPRRLGLGGHVRNDSGWVWIEVEGAAGALAAFGAALREQAPPLAVIDEVTTRELVPPW
jgi:hypothetical protein